MLLACGSSSQQPDEVERAEVERAEVAPAGGSSSPGGPAGAILEAHNQARAEHCAEPLRWSSELASTARSWANRLAQANCSFRHSESTQYGENLYFAAPTTPSTATEAVASWVGERSRYDFGSPGFSGRTGHFTQVVWRGSRELGCASAQCNGGDLWVCNYDPPGNVRGQYRENVRPRSCR